MALATQEMGQGNAGDENGGGLRALGQPPDTVPGKGGRKGRGFAQARFAEQHSSGQ